MGKEDVVVDPGKCVCWEVVSERSVCEYGRVVESMDGLEGGGQDGQGLVVSESCLGGCQQAPRVLFRGRRDPRRVHGKHGNG
jgi:hypothetical protein